MAKGVKFVTAIGEAKYPHLNKPQTKFNPKGDYKVYLILSAENAAPLIEIIGKLVAEHLADLKKEGKLKKAPKVNMPYEAEADDQGGETGRVIFKFKQPATDKDGNPKALAIYDSKAKLMKNPPSIWSGSKLQVATYVSPYYVPAIGAGASLKINAVLLYELVSGSGSNPFTAHEDGYEADEANAEAQLVGQDGSSDAPPEF